MATNQALADKVDRLSTDVAVINANLNELIKLIKGNGRPGLYDRVGELEHCLESVAKQVEGVDLKLCKQDAQHEAELEKKVEHHEVKDEVLDARKWETTSKFWFLVGGAIIGQIIAVIFQMLFK